MIEIKNLLGKFSGLLAFSEFKKEAIRDIITEAVGVEIKSQDIKLKNGTVYLNIKPIYKNQILLKKDVILSRLQKVLDRKSPGDIR